MAVFALIVINKAGGLIYHRTFQEDGLIKLSTNDYLVLAGTFHGIHAITARLNPLKNLPSSTSASSQSGAHHQPSGSMGGGSNPTPGLRNRPEPPTGLEVLESETFRMQCFNTLTGTKFLIFTELTQTNMEPQLRRIYDLYSDYVMKNPFYSLDMPIRCEIFDRKLGSYIRELNSRG